MTQTDPRNRHLRMFASLSVGPSSRQVRRYLSEEQLRGLEPLAGRIIADALKWSSGSTVIDERLIPPIALTCIVLTPNDPPVLVASRVKMALWVCAVDLLFEEESVSVASLYSVVRDCVSIGMQAGWTRSSTPATQYGELLERVIRRVVGSPGWSLIHPLWLTAIARMFDGMLYEYWLERRFTEGSCQEVPSFEEYLYHGQYSIGIPAVWSLVLLRRPSKARDAVVPRLLTLLERCGEIVRLGNDLAGGPKSSRPDATRIHALLAMHRNPELAHDEAMDFGRAKVQALLKSKVRSLAALAGNATGPDSVEADLLRGARYVLDFSEKHDFRSWVNESHFPVSDGQQRTGRAGA